MTVTFFFGKPRQGKTLHMTMNGWNDFQHGRKIYSNYSLTFPDLPNVKFEYTKMKLNDVLGIQYMELDRRPKTLMIQEASKWFDARHSGKKENRMLSSVTGQSGKRNIDILYDDQFATRIDKGLRDVTDYTVLCYCQTSDNTSNGVPIYFEYTYLRGFLGAPTGKNYKVPAFMMQQFYGFYNTYEMTESADAQSEREKKK